MSYKDLFEDAGVTQGRGSLFDNLASGQSDYKEEWEWKPLERIEASVQQSFGALWGAASAATDALGFEKASEWTANRAGELFEKAADHDIVNTEFAKIDDPLDAAKWAVEMITSYVPDLAMMALGGAGLGTAAGKVATTAVGKQATKAMLKRGYSKNLREVLKDGGFGSLDDVIKDNALKASVYKEAARRTARDAGAMVGVSSMEGMQGAGQAWLLDREKRGDNANPWAAMGTGVAQSGLSMLNPLNKVLAGKLPKGKANIAQMTIGEAGEESGQELIALAHEAGIDPSTTFGELAGSPEGRMRLLESGLAGALLGTAFGSGLHQITKDRNTTPKTPTKVLQEEPETVLEETGIDTTEDAVDPSEGPTTDTSLSGTTKVSTLEENLELIRKAQADQRAEQQAPDIRQNAPGQELSQSFVDETTNLDNMIREEASGTQYQEAPVPERRTVPATEELSDNIELIWKAQQEQRDRQREPTIRSSVASVNEAQTVQPEEFQELINGVMPTNMVEREQMRKEAREAELEILGKKRQTFKLAKPTSVEQPAPQAKETTPEDTVRTEETKLAPEEISEVPFANEVIEDVPQEVGPDVAEDQTVQREAAQEEENKRILSTKEQTITRKGWTNSKYDVGDGQTAAAWEKDGDLVVKMNDRKFQLVTKREDGSRKGLGVFTSFEDAQDAATEKMHANDFYKEKNEKKVEDLKLTDEQKERLAKLDVVKMGNSIVSNIASKGGMPEAYDADAVDAAIEGIYKAASTYDPNSKASFPSWAYTNAKGAVLNWRKGKLEKEAQFKDKETDEGSDPATGESQVTKGDTDLTDSAVTKRAKGKPKYDSKPTEVKSLTPEEYLKQKKEEEEASKKKKETTNLVERKKERELTLKKNTGERTKGSQVVKEDTSKQIVDSKGSVVKKPIGAKIKKTKIGKKITQEIGSYVRSMFHGTPDVNWKGEFKEGRPIFLTENRKQASSYSGKSGVLKGRKVTLKNPYVVDFQGRTWSKGPKGVGSAMDVARRQRKSGKYDGVIFLNIVDPGPQEAQSGYDRTPTTQVAVFSNASLSNEKEFKPTLAEKKTLKDLSDLEALNLLRDFNEPTTDAGKALKDLGLDEFIKKHAYKDVKKVYAILKKILPEGALDDVKINVVDNHHNLGILGEYDYVDKQVNMFTRYPDGDIVAPIKMATTLLHEAVHAVTYDALQYDPDITAELNNLRDQLAKSILTKEEKAVYQKYKDDPHSYSKDRKDGKVMDMPQERARVLYMLLNNDELLANATHPDMVKVLAKRPATERKQFMDKIKGFFKRLFNWTTKEYNAFEQIMSAIGRLNKEIEIEFVEVTDATGDTAALKRVAPQSPIEIARKAFYSQLFKVIYDKMPNQMKTQSFLNLLKRNQVKGFEMGRYDDLEKFLSKQPQASVVKKSDILEYLQSFEPDVYETYTFESKKKDYSYEEMVVSNLNFGRLKNSFSVALDQFYKAKSQGTLSIKQSDLSGFWYIDVDDFYDSIFHSVTYDSKAEAMKEVNNLLFDKPSPELFNMIMNDVLSKLDRSSKILFNTYNSIVNNNLDQPMFKKHGYLRPYHLTVRVTDANGNIKLNDSLRATLDKVKELKDIVFSKEFQDKIENPEIKDTTKYNEYQEPTGDGQNKIKKDSYKEVFVHLPENHLTGPAWTDGHFPYDSVPNPIIRMRFNERTTKDGERVLFIEEMQGPAQTVQRGQPFPEFFDNNKYSIGAKWLSNFAQQQGFDYISWTTGSQQRDRWGGYSFPGLVMLYDKVLPNIFGKLAGIKKKNGILPLTSLSVSADRFDATPIRTKAIKVKDLKQLTYPMYDLMQPNGTTSLYDLPENKEKPKKTWKQRVEVMMEGDKRDKPVDKAKDWGVKAATLVKDLGKSMTEVIRKTEPRLIRPIRQMEFGINEKNVEYQRRVQPFFDQYHKMSKEDQLTLDLALMNSNNPKYKAKRDEVLKRNGMINSHKQVEKVLEEIYKAGEEVSIHQYGAVREYFPRRVKDIRALMQQMKEDGDYGIIQAELDSLGKDATKKDKENAIMKMMHTGRFPSLALLAPGSAKRRSIDTVSSEWVKHYENSADALINHIYESNEKIYARKMFGDVNRKKLVERRDALYEQLESKKKMKKKVRKAKVAELLNIEQTLEDYESEFTNGISDLLAEVAPDMSQKDQDDVIRAIRARLTQKGMHGPMSAIRNISLMSVLSSPTSAITQIGDLAFSIYRNGPVDTVKAILGDKIITPQDLDLSHSMKEFQSEGTAKWLDKTLKWSGLQFMDGFGKNTTMNAAILNAQKMSLEAFTKKFGHAYQMDTEQTYQDLKDGKNTRLTRYFAFNELANWQPISLSEMPIQYLTAGNGRIFYALKSYNIKAINSIYRESVHAWRTAKTKQERMQAAKNTGKLVFLMTMAGATADELKDLLLAKDAGTFSDNVHENLLKIAMVSRYTLNQGFSKGITETLLKDVLLPPTGFIDDPMKDIISIFEGEPDFKTIRNLPWGKLPYSWFSEVEEKQDMKNLKKEITEAYIRGKSFGSLERRRNKYNAWARKNDETILTFSSLNQSRARKREADRKK